MERCLIPVIGGVAVQTGPELPIREHLILHFGDGKCYAPCCLKPGVRQQLHPPCPEGETSWNIHSKVNFAVVSPPDGV